MVTVAPLPSPTRVRSQLLPPRPARASSVTENVASASWIETSIDAPARPPANLAVLRCRGQELVTALRRHREAEAALLLESVNVDIGGGD